jgi:hypothetical protein
MKIAYVIIFICSWCFVRAEPAIETPLHQQIKEAMDANKVMEFHNEEGLRKIRFISTDSEIQRRVDPLNFQISKVIRRAALPDVFEMSLDEARKYYAEYAAAVIKYGDKPQLELSISKDTDDKLLRQVIEATCPIGESSVWIRYFDAEQLGSAPPISIQKPIAPKNQINPALKEATQQPAKPAESK